jgi:hypothetical protein
MYANDFDASLGPIVAFFDFKKHPSYKIVGKLKPIGTKKIFDDVWNGTVSKFFHKAEFRQKVKILRTNPVIKIAVEFQECSEVSGMCVNFEDDLEFKLKVSEAAAGVATPVETKPENIDTGKVAMKRPKQRNQLTRQQVRHQISKLLLLQMWPGEIKIFISLFIFRLLRRIGGSCYPMCVSNATYDGYFLHQKE